MKMFSYKKTIALTAFVLSAQLAHAASVTQVNVSGLITTSTCTVDAADLSQNISFGVIQDATLLNAANLTATNFKFTISQCDLARTKATATISSSATATTDYSGYGANAILANKGTAGNVGIAFIGSTSVGSTPTGPLAVNVASKELTLTANSTGQSNGGVLNLGAMVVPLLKANPATAGTITSNATITFNYS